MRTMAVVAVSVMALAGGAVAQTRDKTKTSQPAGREMTVIGCLTQGSQPNTFHLTNRPDKLASELAVGTKGEVPTVTYELVGGSDLAAHLGHKMEVTGRLDPNVRADAEHEKRTTSTTESSSDKNAPKTKVETTEDVEITVRRLHVKNAKMVSKDCK